MATVSGVAPMEALIRRAQGSSTKTMWQRWLIFILSIRQRTNIDLRARRDRAFARPLAGMPMTRRTHFAHAFHLQAASGTFGCRLSLRYATSTSAGATGPAASVSTGVSCSSPRASSTVPSSHRSSPTAQLAPANACPAAQRSRLRPSANSDARVGSASPLIDGRRASGHSASQTVNSWDTPRFGATRAPGRLPR